MSQAVALISIATQEIMSTLGIPGGSIIGHTLSSYQERRAGDARDILLKRVADREIDILEAANQDELLGVLHKYVICANQGAARINLDLLAQAMAGELKGGSIYPDNFQKYMNILSSLTRDEILVIGTYHRCYTTISEEQKRNYTSFLGTLQPNTWQKFMNELVPSSFKTQEHVQIVCGSLIRTGLTTALPPQLGHSPSHSFTILLEEISKLVNFEEAYALYRDY